MPRLLSVGPVICLLLGRPWAPSSLPRAASRLLEASRGGSGPPAVGARLQAQGWVQRRGEEAAKVAGEGNSLAERLAGEHAPHGRQGMGSSWQRRPVGWVGVAQPHGARQASRHGALALHAASQARPGFPRDKPYMPWHFTGQAMRVLLCRWQARRALPVHVATQTGHAPCLCMWQASRMCAVFACAKPGVPCLCMR